MSRVVIVLVSLGALIGALSGLRPEAAASPVPKGEELEVSLSAEEYEFYSGTSTGLIVSFRNRLSEPLRVRPLMGMFVRVWDGLGNLYDASSYFCGGPWSEVLQPGEVVVHSIPLSGAWRIDADGNPLVEGDMVRKGPLAPGQYTVRVVSLQFDDGFEPFPEQPEPLAYGTPTSNPITVTVLDATQPLDGMTARLPRAGKSGAAVFRHRGVEMARAQALAAFGVRVTPAKQSLVLRRGARRVALPLGRLRPAPAKGGPPLPAVPAAVGKGHYVPLRYVASQLGFQVRYDPRRRTYDLLPRM